MRRVFLVALFMAGALAAEKIPAGAKEVQPYTYSYTDAQGNNWMYRQTPFGVTKWQEKDIPKPAFPDQPNPVTVVDLGGQVRFERQTPFGRFVWTKKKTELSCDEKGLLTVARKDTEKK